MRHSKALAWVKRSLIISLSLTCAFLCSGCSGTGNGGGYGGELAGTGAGLTSSNGGTYSNTGGPSVITSTAEPYYYLIGNHTGCSNYPSGYESIGPDVIGVIAYSQSGLAYASSLCSAYTQILSSSMSVVDFDTSVAIYSNQIYRNFPGNPPLLSELETPVAYCETHSAGTGGTEIGTDVSIYTQNGQMYGAIVYGQDENSVPTRYSVAPFAVTQTLASSQATFTGSYFMLGVARNGSAATTGTLDAVISGSTTSTSMTCWLTTP